MRYGTEATAAAVLAETPDLAIVATGATPLPPPFPVTGDAAEVVIVSQASESFHQTGEQREIIGAPT